MAPAPEVITLAHRTQSAGQEAQQKKHDRQLMFVTKN
jgi:hypothetical protein